jgi:hypothetical protein
MRNPFEIFDSIVSFNVVNVIYHVLRRRLCSKKSISNKCVNVLCFSHVVAPKIDVAVAGNAVRAWGKNFVRLRSTLSQNALYMSVVADFVNAFVSNNWLPNLRHKKTSDEKMATTVQEVPKPRKRPSKLIKLVANGQIVALPGHLYCTTHEAFL